MRRVPRTSPFHSDVDDGLCSSFCIARAYRVGIIRCVLVRKTALSSVFGEEVDDRIQLLAASFGRARFALVPERPNHDLRPILSVPQRRSPALGHCPRNALVVLDQFGGVEQVFRAVAEVEKLPRFQPWLLLTVDIEGSCRTNCILWP